MRLYDLCTLVLGIGFAPDQSYPPVFTRRLSLYSLLDANWNGELMRCVYILADRGNAYAALELEPATQQLTVL